MAMARWNVKRIVDAGSDHNHHRRLATTSGMVTGMPSCTGQSGRPPAVYGTCMALALGIRKGRMRASKLFT